MIARFQPYAISFTIDLPVYMADPEYHGFILLKISIILKSKYVKNSIQNLFYISDRYRPRIFPAWFIAFWGNRTDDVQIRDSWI